MKLKIYGVAGVLILRSLLFLFSYSNYGYFLDEFYYLSGAHRPGAGYVDHPPFSIWLMRLQIDLFGDSLLSIRFIPFLAAQISIVLSAMITNRLRGGAASVVLASFTVGLIPVMLGLTKFYSMNSLDLLFWAVAIYLYLDCLEKNRWYHWTGLGLVLGFALLNKYGILMLGAGFFLGMIFTHHRIKFLSPGPYITAFLSVLIFLPHLLWQIEQDWPSLEFMKNASLFKNYFQPGAFMSGLILEWNPMTLPLWFAGLVGLLWFRNDSSWRALGLCVVTAVVVALLGRGKSYYIAPLIFILIPAGSILLFQWQESMQDWMRNRNTMKWLSGTWLPVYCIGIGISGMALAPLSLPLLSPERYIAYEEFLGLQPPRFEKHSRGSMPQHFAGMFGWNELQQEVQGIYDKLSPNERKHTIIVARNYGLAGALDFLSLRDKLPAVGSGHNSFYLWGLPRPEVEPVRKIIFVGFQVEDLANHFSEIQVVGQVLCEECMSYRRQTTLILAGQPRIRLQDLWPLLRMYI